MKESGKCSIIFTAVAGIIILTLGAQAEPPDSLDDLYLTVSNTSVLCHVLLNDSDPNPSHVLSINSFDAVSTQSGTVLYPEGCTTKEASIVFVACG